MRRSGPTGRTWPSCGCKGKPVTTRVDYSQVPQNKTLAVNSGGRGQRRTSRSIFYAEGPGQSDHLQPLLVSRLDRLAAGRQGRPSGAKAAAGTRRGPLARIVVPVPAGEGYILLRFEDTPLRAAAKWITLVTLGAVIIVAVVLRIRRRKVLDKPRT